MFVVASIKPIIILVTAIGCVGFIVYEIIDIVKGMNQKGRSKKDNNDK